MSPIELPMAPVGPSPEAPAEPIGGNRRFRVEGMDCGACAKTVEQAVASLPGVTSARVSFGNGTMAVSGDAADAEIAGAVARAGYRAHPATRRTATPGTPMLFAIASQSMRGRSMSIMDSARSPGVPAPMLAYSALRMA